MVLAVLVTAGALSSGCASPRARNSGRLDVAANFFPIAEMARRTGGDRVSVSNLTPAGVEPHDLELTSRQVDAILDADVVFYLGGRFQPAIAAVARRRTGRTVDLFDHVPPTGGDPHFWQNPRLLARAADVVTTQLAAADAAHGDAIRANGRRYREELLALDGEFERGLETCARRDIVTAHAAFGYLAKRYGLTQRAVAGLAPETEPDAARLAVLGDEIRAKGVTTVFYEDLVSPSVAQALAREAHVKAAVLSPLEGLTAAQTRAGATYFTVMRKNLAALRAALDCE